MYILIACEFSGLFREAFATRGHVVVSCDLLPTEIVPTWPNAFHYQGDVKEILNDNWDLIIGFPPCTDLSYANGAYIHEKRKDGRTEKAIEFAKTIFESGKKCCIENPRGELMKWRKPDQRIQPWMFGDSFIKTTYLWLKGLPSLQQKIKNEPTGCKYWVDVGQSKNRRLQKGLNRNSQDRARGFLGIANAMAD